MTGFARILRSLRSLLVTLSVCWPFVVSLLVFCHAQVPAELIKKLESDEFASRRSAEDALVEWGYDHPELSYDAFYQLSRQHPNAEVRVRCLSVLRTLVSDLYEAEGEGYVGIKMRDQFMRLPGGGEEPVGVLLVLSVVEDSPAAKAGILSGDAIVSLNKEKWTVLPPSKDFQPRIKSMKPRSSVILQVARGEEILDIRVRLSRRPVAADNFFEMPDPDQVHAMEEALREEYFKKWLLDRRNDR